LHRLTDELGISILYITHDLATAYQVSDWILVLYRAHLAEAGAVERVVKEPRHPYTQLLISAIPRAHAARDWLGQDPDSRRDGDTLAAGCCFAERCRHTMPACLAAPPGLYRTEQHRAVACIQYSGHPALPAGNPGPVLSASGSALRTG
jgi:peptide/nickel transport system ATP-binding protein